MTLQSTCRAPASPHNPCCLHRRRLPAVQVTPLLDPFQHPLQRALQRWGPPGSRPHPGGWWLPSSMQLAPQLQRWWLLRWVAQQNPGQPPRPIARPLLYAGAPPGRPAGRRCAVRRWVLVQRAMWHAGRFTAAQLRYMTVLGELVLLCAGTASWTSHSSAPVWQPALESFIKC